MYTFWRYMVGNNNIVKVHAIEQEVTTMYTTTNEGVKKKFVRYEEGARLYSMCKKTFVKIAMEAHAVSKIGKVSLVNVDILDKYLENYRV